jgi:hypothetical protein
MSEPKAFEGFRKLAVEKLKLPQGDGVVTEANLIALRRLLKKGSKPVKLYHVINGQIVELSPESERVIKVWEDSK